MIVPCGYSIVCLASGRPAVDSRSTATLAIRLGGAEHGIIFESDNSMRSIFKENFMKK